MKNKYTKKGLLSTTAVAVVILLAIAVNVWITGKNYSVDVTSNKIYSLSEQTESILKNLDKKVTVYVINNESDVTEAYKKIFKKYEKASDKLNFSYKDPELYPNFTADYVDDTENVANDSVIVKCGKKYRYISSNDYVSYSYSNDYSYTQASSLELESLLTEAINYVTEEKTPVIYTLTGHAEKQLTTSVTSSFEKDNYTVKDLNLLSEDAVPEDCEILMIYGAAKDITKEELKKIQSYMADGGKMYVFLNAGADNLERLSSLLEEYRLDIQSGIVVEGDSSRYIQSPAYLLPEIQISDVTESQYNANVYILAPSVKGIKEIETDGEEDTWTVTSLLTTSDSAYSKVDTSSSVIEKEKNDIDGPFDVATLVSDESGGRLIVTGCDNMLEESIDSNVGGANTDFVLNGINYLTQQESKISIRAKDLTEETAIVPAFSQKMTLIMTVVILPLLLLILGIGVSVSRRKL